MNPPTTSESILSALRVMHEEIVSHVGAGLDPSGAGADVHREADGDTIYAIDAEVEPLIETFFRERFAPRWPCVLIAEGLADDRPLALGAPDASGRLRILIDPIDGTRGLMYDKRSAWILTGVAPDCGDATRLSDITLALKTELPTTKMTRIDQAWAVRDADGARWGVDRIDLHTGRRNPLNVRPSGATELTHGFAQLARFFAGGKDILATIEEALFREVIGPVTAGRARVFEDQYISNAGQLFEVLAGRDRFIADVRPRLEGVLNARGEALGITSHPYDLATLLIARAAGVEITDPWGNELDAPMDTTTPVGFIAYANAALRARIEPVLLRLLDEHLGP